MGVDANALLTKDGLQVTDMLYVLEEQPHVTGVNMTHSSIEDFVHINFKWHGEQRNMSVFFNGSCSGDYRTVYPKPAIFCSIGKWGFSDAIIVFLVEEFGGFYRLNDCTDEWSKYNA